MADKLRVGVVVVAAGSGTRFGGPKQFALLGGKPLLSHSLLSFEKHLDMRDRVVVLPFELLESPEWKSIEAGLSQKWQTVAGGKERSDSVRAGVAALDGWCDLAIVHDGARPFVATEATLQCVAMLTNDPDLAGAIVAAPVTDTLKALADDGRSILHTIDRTKTARAETPQVCRREQLLDALSLPGAASFTDEAQALETLGLKTACLIHRGFNLKVTTPEDLKIAEEWLKGEKR